MAKRQSRRTMSVKGSTYRRFKLACEARGQSKSGRLEELIAPDLEGIEDPGPPPPMSALEKVLAKADLECEKARQMMDEYDRNRALQDAAFSPRFTG